MRPAVLGAGPGQHSSSLGILAKFAIPLRHRLPNLAHNDHMVDPRRPASRPEYDLYRDMSDDRAPMAAAFAHQILATTSPWLQKPAQDLDVLDLGSGYGHTTVELARRCASVVGMEPTEDLANFSISLAERSGLENVAFRTEGVDQLQDLNAFDLVVLDNVYEHLPDQSGALRRISASLRPGGVLFLLTPNKLWPIEAHYGLPFLSYLPLPMANAYLRASRRGTNYEDASYAPTRSALARKLRENGELSWNFTLPGDPAATMAGSPVHYRVGMRMLARFPRLWTISKSLLVVAVKQSP